MMQEHNPYDCNDLDDAFTDDMPEGKIGLHPLHLVAQSVEETATLGLLLANLLSPGDVVSLDGDLGAGKTAVGSRMAWAARPPSPARRSRC